MAKPMGGNNERSNY